jgi:hypothetical protein
MKVRVLYRPEDPTGTASVDRLGALWGGQIFLAAMGTLFLALGANALFRRSSGARYTH